MRAFRRDMLTDLSNPNAAVFFTRLNVATVVLIAGGWYATVACVLGLAGPRRRDRRLKKALDYATGMAFVALGLRLASDR